MLHECYISIHSLILFSVSSVSPFQPIFTLKFWNSSHHPRLSRSLKNHIVDIHIIVWTYSHSRASEQYISTLSEIILSQLHHYLSFIVYHTFTIVYLFTCWIKFVGVDFGCTMWSMKHVLWFKQNFLRICRLHTRLSVFPLFMMM